jgi:hypothetical protein
MCSLLEGWNLKNMATQGDESSGKVKAKSSIINLEEARGRTAVGF